MQSADIAILYEPERGRPLTVARVGDRRLLVAVAEAAIAEADERALALTEADEILGAVQREEAERVRRVLTILVPELRPGERRLELVAQGGQGADGEPGA
jgi:hypothetical protein